MKGIHYASYQTYGKTLRGLVQWILRVNQTEQWSKQLQNCGINKIFRITLHTIRCDKLYILLPPFFQDSKLKRSLKIPARLDASEKNKEDVTYRLVILWGVTFYQKPKTFQIFMLMILQIIETC